MKMRTTTGASVLTAAHLRGESLGWVNRRREPRLPCGRQIPILRGGARTAEGFQPVGLFDCSAIGVGIVTPEPMELGEQFLAELMPDGGMLAAYTVRHCTRAADGRHYKIGAELSSLVGQTGRDPHAALNALLGRDA
jgi:PilZ domain-containing protein